jgi:hypothetical protein
MQIELSDKLMWKLQSMLYSDWAKAYDANKRVKEETNDGTPDWGDFHTIRLQRAKAELDELDALRKEFDPLCKKQLKILQGF